MRTGDATVRGLTAADFPRVRQLADGRLCRGQDPVQRFKGRRRLLQRLGQRSGVGITPRRLLLEAAEHDGLQLGGAVVHDEEQREAARQVIEPIAFQAFRRPPRPRHARGRGPGDAVEQGGNQVA